MVGTAFEKGVLIFNPALAGQRAGVGMTVKGQGEGTAWDTYRGI